MSHTLVIVESPTKARTIEKYLGDGYEVAASVGHVRDLPKDELGVDVDNDFKPKYVTTKTKLVKELRSLASAERYYPRYPCYGSRQRGGGDRVPCCRATWV